jgi:hypothetical protein
VPLWLPLYGVRVYDEDEEEEEDDELLLGV